MSTCPVCHAGNLLSLDDSHDITINGYRTTVPVLYSVCQSCGEEMILPEQIKQNDEHVRRARRAIMALCLDRTSKDDLESCGPFMTEIELQQWNEEIAHG